jgi:serine protease Do
MKIRKSVPIIFGFVGLMLYSNACTTISSRETPIVRIVRDYSPTFVNIRTETIVDLKEHPEWGKYGEQLDRFFEQYYGENYSHGSLKYKTIGSGVILDDRGLIVTNAHVVQKAANIYAVLIDGTILQAKVIGISQPDDLAIIKADLPQSVKAITFADIDDIMIGETVIAMGNPLGLENSITVGVISGKDRIFSSPRCQYACSGLVQTDASINPGNSGGALFNLDGELIGVNLAVAQNAQNIGFAIPVDRIAELLEGFK